jgi:hypothetical protein
MNLLGNYITHRSSTELTVADIFREHWDNYGQKYPVTPEPTLASVLARLRCGRLIRRAVSPPETH